MVGVCGCFGGVVRRLRLVFIIMGDICVLVEVLGCLRGILAIFMVLCAVCIVHCVIIFSSCMRIM